MTFAIGRVAACVLFAMLAMPAVAQESTNNVATMTDWSVFMEDDPKECWGVSSPRESTATRDGAAVTARRGDILYFVTFRPGAGAAGEISFTGGYPFKAGSTVKVAIGTDAFDLFVDGEWAWPAEDAPLLAAMKNGTDAILTGVSGKGTETKDTFSLRGFTAAMEEAEKRCK